MVTWFGEFLPNQLQHVQQAILLPGAPLITTLLPVLLPSLLMSIEIYIATDHNQRHNNVQFIM